jgi:glucosamine--fructose-6-phosphate aminotransferase (isomerizing)
MNLRRAMPADVPALADVAAAAYAQAFAGILEPEALASRDAPFFQAHFSERVERLFLAEESGRVIGYTLVTDGHLDQMFIAPQAQGKGAGAALLEQAEAAGARSLECFRDNQRARAFYESRGWRLARAYEREFIGRHRAFVFYEKAPAREGGAMSRMREETLSCGACAADFLQRGLGAAVAAGQAMRTRKVRHLDVLGRGSSGHAGAVLRYAFARQGGLTVSSAMPSAAASAQALAHLAGNALLAISQSGQSPDLLRYAQAARSAGAYVVAFINADGSPLQACADQRVPLCAGPEASVAATKSVVLSLLAGLGLFGGFHADQALLEALRLLPRRLAEAAACDWSALTQALPGARAAYFVGRGADLGVAKELALKAAEVLGLPALAFSSAEFQHGPLAAVSASTPVIGLTSDTADLPSVLLALERARGQGAPTLLAHGFAATGQIPVAQLPLPPSGGTLADALLALVPAYLALEAAALAAGRDPDRPSGLTKITQTL